MDSLVQTDASPPKYVNDLEKDEYENDYYSAD